MANLFIAIPCYGGQIFAQCMRGVLQLTHVLREQGHQFTLSTTQGESLVQRARNTLVHNFLKTDCDRLLFIDADIEFEASYVLGMLEADKPVVGGAYPKKSLNEEEIRAAAIRGERRPLDFAGEFVVNVDQRIGEKDERGFVRISSDKGCVPVLELGTGFLMIKREVFIAMAKAHPEMMHISDAKDTWHEVIHSWFDCAIVDGRYLSEDYLFCRRWLGMGGQIWCYLPARLKHIGTHTYSGDLTKKFIPDAPQGASEWSDIPSLPDEDPQKRWHLYRYSWAAERIQGQRVANAACGAGYGNDMLGSDVVGFDRSEAALAIAREKYKGEFKQCDVEHETFDGFDTLVSLETFEHLKDPVGWLRNVSPSVTELVVSAPIIPTKHVNEFHLHDFTETELVNIVRAAGWTILETCKQSEWVPNAVLLIHATRGAAATRQITQVDPEEIAA